MTGFPWNDRSGRFNGLRATVLAFATAPALWITFSAATGRLGPMPLDQAINETGHWAVRLLLATLAVTPLRRINGWNRLIAVRRMLGLIAFAYAAAHLTLFIADQSWNVAHAASEIAFRPYLTIGFAALAGLSVLAATSTDGAIRRLRRRWQQVHRAVYVLAALAVLHFFMQSKINATEATLMMGFWLLLMGWRTADRTGASLRAPRTLIAVATASALATAGLEALWYEAATGVPWRTVLEANLTLTPWPRPAWGVLAAGLAAAILPVLRFIVRFPTMPRAQRPPSR